MSCLFGTNIYGAPITCHTLHGILQRMLLRSVQTAQSKLYFLGLYAFLSFLNNFRLVSKMHVITNNITFLSFLSFPPTLAPGPPCPHFPRLLTPLPLPFREVCSSLSLLASLCPPNRPFPFRSLLILSSLGLQSSDPRLHVTPVLLSCSWLPATSQMFITGPQVCGAICVSVCTVE